MKIGYYGKQNSYVTEMLKRLKLENSEDEFLTWLPADEAPSFELDVLIAIGPVGSREFEAQKKLGLLQMASAGYDGVDIDAADKAGVWVASAPTTKTGNGESVAELAVLLMLAASRRLNEALTFTRSSAEERPEKPEMNRALFGKTVCIIGLGGIGDLLIERLRGFGMVLTGVDHHPERAPEGVKVYSHDEMSQALTAADYVVLAVPATAKNENMIDANLLAVMKEHAVLVNVARGALVDETALIAAVASGRLYGAGLDVVKVEPVSAGNPLLREPRIFVTPHIAGATDLMLNGTVEYLRNVLDQYRAGFRPDGIVNQPDSPRVALRERSPETRS